jgi:hypothetical protein
MMMRVTEVIMKVIVVKRRKPIIMNQVMKIWMTKPEMNRIIQIMKVVNKIKTKTKKRHFVFAVLIRTLMK